MKKNKMIASGYIVNEEDLKVLASLYEVKEDNVSEESASADAVHHVVLKYRNSNAAEAPAAPMTFEDIAAEAEEMAIPSLKNPEEKIALSAPVMITYAKTKAFQNKMSGKINVHADIRYEC